MRNHLIYYSQTVLGDLDAGLIMFTTIGTLHIQLRFLKPKTCIFIKFHARQSKFVKRSEKGLVLISGFFMCNILICNGSFKSLSCLFLTFICHLLSYSLFLENIYKILYFA